jgi:hypothetical protein
MVMKNVILLAVLLISNTLLVTAQTAPAGSNVITGRVIKVKESFWISIYQFAIFHSSSSKKRLFEFEAKKLLFFVKMQKESVIFAQSKYTI